MSSPEPINLPYPESFLRIGGDPTVWALDEISLTVSPKLLADGPAALSVVKPVAGTLLLAPRLAGSLVLTPLPPAGGWVPCAKLASPYLYLPSPAGIAPTSPGYMLAGADADLETVQQAITAAMSGSTRLTVNVTLDGTGSFVVINGAQLPFVVLATAVAT
jgi:hypothetical protein